MHFREKAKVNFINVLLGNFLYKSAFFTKILLPTPKRTWKKLQNYLLYEKIAQKTLMKLTPAINFINILRSHFSYKFFAKAKM